MLSRPFTRTGFFYFCKGSVAMIEVKSLYKRYGNNEVLKNINLKIEEADVFGFIGFSGAGKTSLVRCISALEPVSSGNILIDNIDITTTSKKNLKEIQKEIGVVFQHFNLINNATVYDNIAFPLIVAKKDKEFIDKRIKELLKIVGLEEKIDAYPAQLSGGQKQRVGIARALANNPKIIICDEATSALDPTTTKQIISLLKEINKSLKITMLVITHEMDIVKELCNKVAVLENGVIVESGKVIDLYINSKNVVTRKFFETVEININSKTFELTKNQGQLYRITFINEVALKPLISHVMKTIDVEISILTGKIEEFNTNIVGCLIINISGSKDNINLAIDYLKNKNVMVEEVNHAYNI